MKVLRATPEFLEDMHAFHGFTIESLREKLSTLIQEEVVVRTFSLDWICPLFPGESEIDVHVSFDGTITLKEPKNGKRG